MWKHAPGSVVVAVPLTALSCLPGLAQTQTKAQAPDTVDPGVTALTIMDGPEVRVLRVEVSQPAHAA